MVKPLAFKGEKKSKKRKAPHVEGDDKFGDDRITDDPQALITQSAIADGAEDDSWVTAESSGDVAGPVVIVLPSAKATCVACDANGKVFASEIENIVDGNAATAEPHDVRQVWIANRVAGTEEVSLKGHHGR